MRENNERMEMSEFGKDKHRNMDELDEIPNETHNGKTDCDSLGDLDEFYGHRERRIP